MRPIPRTKNSMNRAKNRHAPPAQGNFPVILFATGGGGPPLTHTPVGELVASYGYYFLTEPSEGRDDLPVYLDPITLDNKVRDMEMGFDLRARYPGADFDRVLAGL